MLMSASAVIILRLLAVRYKAPALTTCMRTAVSMLANFDPENRGRILVQVPDVLLSGNHREIARWRRRKSLEKTLEMRPELLQTARLTDDERRMVERHGEGRDS